MSDLTKVIDTLTRAICAEFPDLDGLAVRGTIACALPPAAWEMLAERLILNAAPPPEESPKRLVVGEKPAASPMDVQHGGDHYKKLGVYQPWQVLAVWMTPEELKGAMKKDVIGYLAREADKGGREDIEKACHTLQIYLELTNDGS